MIGLFGKKNLKEIGLHEVQKHKGKKRTYQNYLKVNPEMAEKYLVFVAKNPSVSYIKWDANKEVFVNQ